MNKTMNMFSNIVGTCLLLIASLLVLSLIVSAFQFDAAVGVIITILFGGLLVGLWGMGLSQMGALSK